MSNNSNHQIIQEDTYDKYVAVHLLSGAGACRRPLLHRVHFSTNLLFVESELTSHCVRSIVFRSGLFSL